jgi:TRAP-type C4-dicarboxylate transport system permease small subunit
MPNLVDRLARGMAVLGGMILTVLVILVFVSVLGRGLNTFGNSDWLTGVAGGFADWLIGTGVGPIEGDFEVVESGIAFVIFCFLPICQLYGGHAAVDVFTSLMPAGVNKFLQALWEVVLAGVLILITVQLFEGMMDKYHNGQTSFLLQYPVWWAYAASFVAAIVTSLVGLYCAVARVIEGLSGRAILPGSGGAVH